MQDNTASSITETLTAIWQRVLQRPSIAVDDNFFALGGDPASARQLFAEIARDCGRRLSPLFIWQAPTIATLAPLLEQLTAPRLRPCVVLKEGGWHPPVFLAHGLGGNVMELFEAAKHLLSLRPLYGLQAKGADGLDPPPDRIEAMAQYHLDAIKALQPVGPYFLIGYSLGGLVMLEVAQRLLANGEPVALLAMVDSYPHMRFLPLKPRINLLLQLARRYATAASPWAGRQAHAPISRGAEEGRHTATKADLAAYSGDSSPDVYQLHAERVTRASRRALGRYRPRFYPGKIRFVRAAVASVFPRDPLAVWGHLAKGIDVATVPGDHLGMITTYAGDLASVLSRFLNEASD